MTNSSKIILASGIVFGIGAIYALEKDISFDKVVDFFDKNKEKFQEFVRNLLEIALEVLEKVYEWIVEFIRAIMFKLKIKLG